jgi:hypothetical protein
LGLATKGFQCAGQQDNQAISGIRGFATECGVRSGLARLNIPDHETSALPRPGLSRVLQEIQNVIGHSIQSADDTRRPFESLEKIPESLPVKGIDGGFLCGEPWDIRLRRENHSNIHLDGKLRVEPFYYLFVFGITHLKRDTQTTSQTIQCSFIGRTICWQRDENRIF